MLKTLDQTNEQAFFHQDFRIRYLTITNLVKSGPMKPLHLGNFPMRQVIIPVFVILSSFFLSGCYLADGVAQLTKMATGDRKSGKDAQPARPPAEEPPPANSEATQPRTAVSVETLPAP